MAKGNRSVKQATKQPKSSKRRTRSVDNIQELHPGAMPDRTETWNRPQRLEFLSEAQYQYAQLIYKKPLVIGEGPAGTGKSYVATAIACQKMLAREISQIIVTRPVVATEELGFLPGDMDEKCAPYFKPIRDIMVEWMGETHLELMIKRGYIQFAPLAYLRGLTFSNAFVLLDEAQNTTPKQMKLLLTRIGEDTTVVIDGDVDQKDIKGASGLEDAVKRLKSMPECGHLVFHETDIVRSGLVREIMKRYRSDR